MTDAMEAVGQRVLKEAADELLAIDGHDLGLAVGAIIPPLEAHRVAIDGEDAAVGDSDAVGVAAEIGKHLGGSAKGRLGEDDPLEFAPVAERLGKAGGICKRLGCAWEGEFAGFEGGGQLLQKEPAIETGEDFYRQEEPGSSRRDPPRTVRGETAAGNDTVNVGMMMQGLSPGVQYRDEADISAEMPGIGGDRS